MPKVGAPDCMDMELAKTPNMHGRARTDELGGAAPASTSASTCASVPAAVTGLMAPDRMKGVTMVAWLARA